jgi:hypothetical protein
MKRPTRLKQLKPMALVFKTFLFISLWGSAQAQVSSSSLSASPQSMDHRHPFPGPGLGVRILGAVNTEFADLLRRADAIFIQELHNTIDPETQKSWYELTSQAFAVFFIVDRLFRTTFAIGLSYVPTTGRSKHDRTKETQSAFG